MEKNTSKSFDYLNFFYGLGAAIILVAALFKFLSWPYAEELFIIGLTSEALIFLISAFEWKSPNIRYEWDRLFPELKGEEESTEDDDVAETIKRQVQKKQLSQMVEELQAMSNAAETLNRAADQLTRSISLAENNYQQMSDATEQYKSELDKLKNRLIATNFALTHLEEYATPK